MQLFGRGLRPARRMRPTPRHRADLYSQPFGLAQFGYLQSVFGFAQLGRFQSVVGFGQFGCLGTYDAGLDMRLLRPRHLGAQASVPPVPAFRDIGFDADCSVGCRARQQSPCRLRGLDAQQLCPLPYDYCAFDASLADGYGTFRRV